MSEPFRSVGVFKYHPKDDGWYDTFRIVDDDGMPFDLTALKAFEGQLVTITVEAVRNRNP